MTRRNLLTFMALFALVAAICVLQVIADDDDDAPPVSRCHSVIARSASGKTRRLNLDELASEAHTWYKTVYEVFRVGVCENNARCGDGSPTGACTEIEGQSSFRSIGVWPDTAPPIIFEENASPLGSIVLETNEVNGEKTRVRVHCNPYYKEHLNFTYTPPRPSPGVRVHQFTFSHRDACGVDPLPPIQGMCSNLVVSNANGQKKAHFNLDELSQISLFNVIPSYDPTTDRLTHFGVCGNINCHFGYEPYLPTRTVGACTGHSMEHPDPSTYITTAMYPSNVRDMKFTWITESFNGGALQIDLPLYKQKYLLSIVVVCDPNAALPFARSIFSPVNAPPPWKHTIYVPHRTGCGRPL